MQCRECSSWALDVVPILEFPRTHENGSRNLHQKRLIEGHRYFDESSRGRLIIAVIWIIIYCYQYCYWLLLLSSLLFIIIIFILSLSLLLIINYFGAFGEKNNILLHQTLKKLWRGLVSGRSFAAHCGCGAEGGYRMLQKSQLNDTCR